MYAHTHTHIPLAHERRATFLQQPPTEFSGQLEQIHILQHFLGHAFDTLFS